MSQGGQPSSDGSVGTGSSGRAQAAGGGNAQVAPSGTADEIRVELLTKPAAGVFGLVNVSVPSQRDSFVVALPKDIYADLPAQALRAGSASLERGGELPAWLAFNLDDMTLIGKFVPADSLPIRLLIEFQGRRTVVVVTRSGLR